MNFNSTLFLDQKKRFSGILLASLFCCAGPFLAAQSFSPSVVSAGGGRVATTEMTLDWTLGEALVGDFSNASDRLTVGFHQPSIKVEIVKTSPFEAEERSAAAAKTAFSTACWPNPATESVTARVEAAGWPTATVQLTDAAGRVIQKMDRPTNADFQINLSDCSNGQYFLHFFSPDGQSLGARKITLIR